MSGSVTPTSSHNGESAIHRPVLPAPTIVLLNAFREKKGNSSWNVMWNKRKAVLNGPVDFLKVGHHGSVNATPWNMGGSGAAEPAAILDAVLPVARKARAKAVVSTQRSTYETIPRSDLLAELGRRVSNARSYAQELAEFRAQVRRRAEVLPNSRRPVLRPQPQRTDLERMLHDVGYIDVLIDPA